MKKIIFLFLSIVMMVSMLLLVSCGKSDNNLLGIRMSAINSWLRKSNASDVVKVEQIHTYYGIAPDISMTSYYSTEQDVISEYLECYKNVKLTPALMKASGGGGSTVIVFTFADGSSEKISIINGYYIHGLLCFDVHYQSGHDCTDDMNAFYRFNVSEDSYSVYTCTDSPELVKEAKTGASDLRFVEYKGEELSDIQSEYFLETSFGKIYVLSDSICYVDVYTPGAGVADDGYYKLYGATFSEIIE